MANLNDMNFELLKQWCDALIAQQITDRKSKGVYGGVLCDGCGYIHGRCADAIYPMVTLFAATDDRKYLDCAEKLYIWQKNNVRKYNGLNINDTFNMWIGVTEFYLISLGLTLMEFGNILPKDTYSEWREDFASVSRACFANPIFLYSESSTVATNYLVAYLTANAIAYKVTGEEKYRDEAISYEDTILKLICDEGHFYGEGPGRICNDKGHKNIDLGYNIEESIGNFALYAKLLGREKIIKICDDMVGKSLEFMLPDGGWDNSWGSRASKWTYYGSRTSDGATLALRLAAEYEPRCYEACYRYTLLMKNMTYGGLLSGGKMYNRANVISCNHHAFTHAKTVAYVVNHPFVSGERMQLPQDKEYGFKHLKSAGVTLVSIGNFRGTMTTTSIDFHGGQSLRGGSISCLYHTDCGVLLSSNGRTFNLTEPTNMQVPFDFENSCQTMRIDNGEYSSMLCKNAETEITDNEYIAKGFLENTYGETKEEYVLKYTFFENTFKIGAKGKGTLHLPFVCDYSEKITFDECSVKFGKINVTSTVPLKLIEGLPGDRQFNTVGGFVTLPLYCDLDGECEITVDIHSPL